MKKTVLAVLTIAAVLLIGATTVFAAGSKGICGFADVQGTCGNHTGHHAEGICRFADNDKDGICDYYADCKEQWCEEGYGNRHANGHGYGKGRCGR